MSSVDRQVALLALAQAEAAAAGEVAPGSVSRAELATDVQASLALADSATQPGDLGTMAAEAAADYVTVASGNATYVPWRTSTRRRIVVIGDSIVYGNTVYNTATGQNWGWGNTSWATWAAALSKQNLILVRNSGVGGDTSTGMLSRFAADVLAYSCDMVIIGGPSNDYTNSITVATTISNLTQMYALARAAGIEPVQLTLTPRNNDATGLADSRTRSAAIRELCAKQGVRCIDAYAPLADLATGGFQTGTNGNDLHPNAKGSRILGQAIVDAIYGAGTPLKPGVYTPASSADPLNLITNPLMQTDANSDGIADTWLGAGSATSGSRSIASDSGVVGGKLQNLVVTSGASSYRLQQQPAGIVEHRYAASGRIKTSGIEAESGQWLLQFAWLDAGNVVQSPYYYPLGTGQNCDLVDGYFYLEIPAMPVTATKLDVRLAVVSGAGTVGFTEMGLVDLTAAGLTGIQPQ